MSVFMLRRSRVPAATVLRTDDLNYNFIPYAGSHDGGERAAAMYMLIGTAGQLLLRTVPTYQ